MKGLFLSTALIMGLLTNLPASERSKLLLREDNTPPVPTEVYSGLESTIAKQPSDFHKEEILVCIPQPNSNTVLDLEDSAQTEDQLLQKLTKLFAEKGLIIIQQKSNQTPETTESTLTSQNLYRELQEAFRNLDIASEILNNDIIDRFKSLLMPEFLSKTKIYLIQKRINAAENTVLDYFNSAIDYKQWTKNQLLTIPFLTTVVLCVSLNIYVIYKYVFSDNKFYPAISPMAGGTLVLVINSLAINISLHHTNKSPLAISHKKWKQKLSNSNIKFYISQLIAQTFVFRNEDKSPQNIKNRLEKTLSDDSVNNYRSLFEFLFPNPPIEFLNN